MGAEDGVDVAAAGVSKKAVADGAWVMLATILPYFLCKLAVAANTAFIEDFFGATNDTASVAAEADTLQWEFLWMGTAQGGMRAVSVATAAAVHGALRAAARRRPGGIRRTTSTGEAVTETASLLGAAAGTGGGERGATNPSATSIRAASSSPSRWSFAHLCHVLFRGRLAELVGAEGGALRTGAGGGGGRHECGAGSGGAGVEGVDHHDPLLKIGDTAGVAFLLTTAYSVAAAVIMYFSATTFFLHATSGDVHERLADYMRGFAVGVLPIQWLYLYGQFAMGLEAAGIALLYDGIINSTLATVFAYLWYPAHGVYGIGLGMSVGAWVAWGLNALHFAVDPLWRAVGASWLAAPRGPPGAGGGIYHRHGLFRMVNCFRNPRSMGWVYARLALPFALANMMGLIQDLLTAALVTKASSDEAVAFSVSNAYFQTLSIAMLGVSSAVTAVVAARAPAGDGRAHDGTDESVEHHAHDASIEGMTPANGTLPPHGDGGRDADDDGHPPAPTADHHQRRRSYFIRSLFLTSLIAAVAVGLPLLAPEPFAVVFGGEVYAYGTGRARELLPTIKKYNYINGAASFVDAVGMGLGATLYAWRRMWPATGAHAVASAVGLVWACLAQDSDTALVACGPLVSGVVQCAVLVCLLVRWRGEFFGVDTRK